MLLDALLRERVQRQLRSFSVRSAPPGANAAAAVALVLVEQGHGANLEHEGLPAPAGWSRDAAVLLTRRSAALSRHAGQWALPGGRVEAGETPEAAALRELQEEVGLVLEAAHVLGRLDDYVSRSGFVITPVVCWGGAAEVLRPDAAEVASVHRIPVHELMRTDAPMLEPSEEPGRQILRMPVGGTWIAAPTAAVLYQFRELCIAGRPTRVAHFDQPAFARR